MMEREEQSVTIYSEGKRLRGNFCLPRRGAPCVVMSHGLESSKDGEKWLVFSPRLCDAGFASLRFSYRGCGEGEEKSEGDFEDTTLTGRVADYRAAIAFARSRGVDHVRLGVIGSSFGGMVATAAGSEGVKAMVLLATPFAIAAPPEEVMERIMQRGYMELGSGRRLRAAFYRDLQKYDLPKAVQRVRCPLLIMQGSEDDIVHADDARLIYERASEPRRLEIIAGADHVFSAPEHLEQVVKLSLEWFERYL